jgi:hypothetical protein
VILSVRRAMVTAAATATLLAFAGCGGDDKAADKAADPAAEQPSATTSATGTSDDASEPTDAASETADQPRAGGADVSGSEFAELMRAAMDKATTAHLTVDLGGQGSAEGDADYSKKPPELAMKLSMAALNGDSEIRMVDDTMYLKSAAFGDTWISFPLDDPNSPLGPLGSQLDPTQQFERFANAVTSATYEGAEDVEGESLDHYVATVDTAKLLEQMPAAGAASSQLPPTMSQDWWFDDEGRVRKFSSDLGAAAGKIEVTLSDWGKDVSIEAPPSDEVTTMPSAGGA